MKSVHGAEHFPFASVKLILKTEEYTGCMVMQKEHNISPKRQRLNRGELPKYKVDDHHEAIIDRETFDRVQAIMAQRSVQNESRKKLDSPFAGLIRCGKCGRSVCGHRTPTSRQNGDSRFVTWRCVGRITAGNATARTATTMSFLPRCIASSDTPPKKAWTA